MYILIPNSFISPPPPHPATCYLLWKPKVVFYACESISVLSISSFVLLFLYSTYNCYHICLTYFTYYDICVPLVPIWLIPAHLLKLNLVITFSPHSSLIFFCPIQLVNSEYSSYVLP